MARLLFVLALTWIANSSNLSACDACGCSLNGSALGVLQGYRNNFFGIGFYRTPFRTLSHHPGKDYFYTTEIFGRYHLSPRWKIALAQPFQSNMRVPVEGEKSTVKGLGDTRLMAAYAILNDKYFGKSGKIYWETALGTKLPTGKYDKELSSGELPENFNIGSGSLGLITQTALQLDFGKFGLSTHASWLWNSKSPTGYRFGSQSTAASRVFMRWFLGDKIVILPNAGLSGEWIQRDQFANGRSNTSTGGQGLLFTSGINAKVFDFFVGASLQMPLAGEYSNGEVSAMNRVNLDISYFF